MGPGDQPGPLVRLQVLCPDRWLCGKPAAQPSRVGSRQKCEGHRGGRGGGLQCKQQGCPQGLQSERGPQDPGTESLQSGAWLPGYKKPCQW